MIHGPGSSASPPSAVRPDRRVEGWCPGIVGEHRRFRDVVSQLRRLAPSRPPSLLLVGEAGTGKSLLARAYHQASPARADSFLSIDCRTTPAPLLETELFGYEPGAFDGAVLQKRGLLEGAGAGVVFLRHVENLPVRLQPKLLRALADGYARRVGGRQEYPILGTIIASSGRPLERDVALHTFRRDLLEQLDRARCSVPPLRERGDDAVLLAEHALERTVRAQGLLPVSLTEEAKDALREYRWPGNVRELQDVITEALDVSGGRTIRADHLRIRARRTVPITNRPLAITIPSGGRSLKDIEAQILRHALSMAQGSEDQAARMLGVSRETLHAKLDACQASGAPSAAGRAGVSR